jgi:hypothetical protein
VEELGEIGVNVTGKGSVKMGEMETEVNDMMMINHVYSRVLA